MADEGGGIKGDGEVLGWLFGFLIILAILVSIFGTLQSRLGGGSVDGVRTSLFGGEDVTEQTSLGTWVRTRVGTSVWDIPGGSVLGTHGVNTLGVLIDGPRFRNGETWFEIDFKKRPDGWVTTTTLETAGNTLGRFITSLKRVGIWVSSILSLVLFIFIFWLFRRIGFVRGEASARMQAIEKKLAEQNTSGQNEKWERILSLVASENPGDWRVAILEADIMLDELMARMQYRGDTLGEKLKGVEKADFMTIDMAWEAHKVRNRIAHSGSDFILTHREARRVIDLFRQVFDEFEYI